MNRNFGLLLKETESEVQAALKETHLVTRYIGCAKACEASVKKMKGMVIANPFTDTAEEIRHFKYEAPEIYSQLFFYHRLIHLESGRPYVGTEAFMRQLRKEQLHLDEFFQNNDYICRYYNQGATHSDNHLFVRRPEEQWIGDERGTLIPPDFTIGTYWVSSIKANGRLGEWIAEQLDPAPVQTAVKPQKKKLPIRWTASKVDAIVLLSGLFEAGCFNEGRCTHKEVIEWGEEVLGISLGQYNVTLGEVSIQKDPLKVFKKLSDFMKRYFESLT